MPLLPDQENLLGQVIKASQDGAYDALLISGDLFDRSLPSEEAVLLWSLFLRELHAACPKLPLLVISGNHDSAARVAYASDALSLVKIHVRGGAGQIEVPVELTSASGEKVQIWLIPFLWAGDLDAGEKDAELRFRTQEETLAAAIKLIEGHQDPDAIQVALSHCFSQGGEASDSERVLVGTATHVHPSLFSSFDYVALGHLHRPQKISERIWYSGSILPYSFSEANDAKCLLEVTLRKGQPPVVEMQPLSFPRPMQRLSGALSELLDDPKFSTAENSFVEITLRQADAGKNPFSLLKQRFQYLLHLRYASDDLEGEALEGHLSEIKRGEDLFADYRRFASDLGLSPEDAEARATLVKELMRSSERKAEA